MCVWACILRACAYVDINGLQRLTAGAYRRRQVNRRGQSTSYSTLLTRVRTYVSNVAAKVILHYENVMGGEQHLLAGATRWKHHTSKHWCIEGDYCQQRLHFSCRYLKSYRNTGVLFSKCQLESSHLLFGCQLWPNPLHFANHKSLVHLFSQLRDLILPSWWRGCRLGPIYWCCASSKS